MRSLKDDQKILGNVADSGNFFEGTIVMRVPTRERYYFAAAEFGPRRKFSREDRVPRVARPELPIDAPAVEPVIPEVPLERQQPEMAATVAFLLSELADFAVYTPLARRRLVAAVVASSFVGLVVDSIVFLWLAFGSLDFLAGQVVGKAWMVLLSIPLVAWLRRRDERAGIEPA